MFGHAGKDLMLSEGQRQAVMQAATAPVCILTGGPGCGKTTTTKYIVDLWKGLGKKLALCAPTGWNCLPSACFFYRVTCLLIWCAVQCACKWVTDTQHTQTDTQHKGKTKLMQAEVHAEVHAA